MSGGTIDKEKLVEWLTRMQEGNDVAGLKEAESAYWMMLVKVKNGTFDSAESVPDVIQALKGHDIPHLQRIVAELKQVFGGEGWAIGEMVERAIEKYGTINGLFWNREGATADGINQSDSAERSNE